MIADTLGKNIENQGRQMIGSKVCHFAKEIAEKSEGVLTRMDGCLEQEEDRRHDTSTCKKRMQCEGCL